MQGWWNAIVYSNRRVNDHSGFCFVEMNNGRPVSHNYYPLANLGKNLINYGYIVIVIVVAFSKSIFVSWMMEVKQNFFSLCTSTRP